MHVYLPFAVYVELLGCGKCFIQCHKQHIQYSHRLLTIDYSQDKT